MSDIKRLVIFIETLWALSGAERLMSEEAKHFEKMGIETTVLTFDVKEETRAQLKHYNTKVEVINKKGRIGKVLALRKKISELEPDFILSIYGPGCRFLYLATLGTKFVYGTHIPGTIFWFTPQQDLQKYTLVYRKVFHEIRDSVVGHREFLPPIIPKMNILQRIKLELLALYIHRCIRKAKVIFVHSGQMRWEVNKLYGKDAVPLKGAYAKEIFLYYPTNDVKNKVGLTNKRVILNVNRLQPRKRVSLLIKAFSILYHKHDGLYLLIGGEGPEKQMLQNLARNLKIEDRVKFLGFVNDDELWNYLASCDVFVHPNWAEFAISPYEALALKRKVVWSTEMEEEKVLERKNLVFPAFPTPEEFARVIDEALHAEPLFDDEAIKVLQGYSWDKYAESIINEIKRSLDSR